MKLYIFTYSGDGVNGLHGERVDFDPVIASNEKEAIEIGKKQLAEDLGCEVKELEEEQSIFDFEAFVIDYVRGYEIKVEKN